MWLLVCMHVCINLLECMHACQHCKSALWIQSQESACRVQSKPNMCHAACHLIVDTQYNYMQLVVHLQQTPYRYTESRDQFIISLLSVSVYIQLLYGIYICTCYLPWERVTEGGREAEIVTDSTEEHIKTEKMFAFIVHVCVCVHACHYWLGTSATMCRRIHLSMSYMHVYADTSEWCWTCHTETNTIMNVWMHDGTMWANSFLLL